MAGLLVTPLTDPAGATPASAPSPTSSASPAGDDTVPRALRGKRFTLVTGDRVTLDDSRGATRIDFEPAEGREGVGFFRTATGRDINVIPTDVAPLVASGQVDEVLFNLSALERLGLDDGADEGKEKDNHRPLSLIIRHGGDRLPPDLRAAADGKGSVPLESIGATAVPLPDGDRGEFWKSLSAPASAAETAEAAKAGNPRLRPAVQKVWLDTPVQLTDAESADPDPAPDPAPVTAAADDVPVDDLIGQINATAPKSRGLDGTGVKVAVLDTGVRTTHPDLVDRVSKSVNHVSWDSETGDVDGHGTHVAGIIGGTGAASGGKYEGVAPGVEIVSGRVLSGPLGQLSHIINGMEWAADEGVDIVNMSLGSTVPTDGTDPWSLATDALLDQGVLPVVSVGNSGPGSFTVTPPSAAAGALAVGAAGGDDAVASFSSRGPLFGNYIVKPNVKAPGVAVTAARAAGTDIGDVDPEGPQGPVDENYTRLSGTSMAAPAVAGAAALVMQAHPDWTPRQVSQALVSSAEPSPGESVYDQGSGLIDVERAVTQDVRADAHAVDFGHLTWPRDPDTARKVTFTNTSDSPVTLGLGLDVTVTRGDLPAGLLGLSGTRLTVPAHGTASVAVELRDSGVRTGGTLSALLTATATDTDTAEGTVVRVPVGLTLEPESYDLTVHLRDQFGDPASDISLVSLMPLDRALIPFERPIVATAGATVTLRAPAGTYGISAIISRYGPDSHWFASDHVLAGEPFIRVKEPTDITLGGTAARKLGNTVDAEKAERIYQASGILQRQTRIPNGQTGPTSTQISVEYSHLPPDYWAVPSTTRPDGSTYTTYYREDLAEGYRVGDIPDGAPGDGYDYPTATGPVYYLANIREGGIPSDLTGRVGDSALARTEARYGASEQAGRYDRPFPLKSKLATATLKGIALDGRRVNVPSPGTRTEYYSASKDITWSQELRWSWQNADSVDPLRARALFTEPEAFRPGRRVEHWNHPVGAPALAADGRQLVRSGDTVTVDLPLGGDSEARHLFTSDDVYATYDYTLSRDGRAIAKSRDGAKEFPRNTALAAWTVPADTGTYTLKARADRSQWNGLSTGVEAAWTFRSGPATNGEQAALPLSSVRFEPPVDEWSRAGDHQVLAVPFEVRRTGDQPRGTLRGLTVEASFDDGTTWERVPVVKNRALITHPALSALPAEHIDRNGHGYVSLRAKGSDRASSFEVTVKKAYKIRKS
ncbi:S8 family peptidase [Streptomyces sp. NPDC101062]|uniref:S8 family peptidase n=1 Tax=unclassified Streptomyces TaxID=2593676 RepID=UPI0037FFB94E